MGMATNLVIFCIVLSGFFQLVDPVNFKAPYVSLIESLTGKTLVYDDLGNPQFNDVSNQFCLDIPSIGNRCFGSVSLPGLFLFMLGVAGVGAFFGIIPGTSSFPNPYLLFSAGGVLLLGFFTFPTSLLTSATAPLVMRVTLIPLFMGTYVIAFYSWYRGGGTP